MVYTAENLSLAALELLVHLNVEEQPPDLVAIWAEVADENIDDSMEISKMPDGWQKVTGNPALRRRGDRWQKSAKSLALAVPSVVVPEERNILLNPEVPEFSTALKIGPARTFSLDRRLFVE